ncbi:bacteriophage HK97-gp10 putative tail-component [Streptomyces sp. KhCrAH-43]|uniref:HK97 gp10 family phage protein n=1 Tax=unclassified Streptomyces TaxID=2593676 RepID=UPI00035F8CE5|nr:MULTISPECIES: HK97 gp10 family phage protein [unclassified Streptomyces]MYX67361.1 HK97 gp10 family phage protein [Streptomyces sp. SID8373]RAJ53793.1 bacteriophage HK97-gp10 putative tail-component [Streptomyces sp. KhCrAH-43]
MTTVEIYDDAIDALVHDPHVQADLAARMDRVVAVVKATAPVDTGLYKATIHRVEEPDEDGAVHVDAPVDYAIYVELGTRQTDGNGRRIHPPRHVLGNALDAAGGDH